MAHTSIALSESSTSSVAEAWREFPATEQLTYMDVAARGVISRAVRAALDTHLDARMLGSAEKDEYFTLVERTRSRFAQLINAHADEVALTKNVSEGLNIVAAGMPWHAGDNVVLCPELEHPNNVYCWLNLRRRGVEVRLVSPRGDRIPIDAMVSRIDARTRVVTVSTVTFAPGFRTEVDRLGRACRERGVFFMVDAAQSCGVLSTDVAASQIDGLAVSTQKGLLGLYGMGFLGCAAAEASMAQLLAYDIQAIERHVVGLSHQLAQGFLDLGLPVCGGSPGLHLAHIVAVGQMGSSHYGTEDERFNQLYTFLNDHDVRLSIRRGVLRFSLHIYNTLGDVERVLELTRQWLRG